MQIEGLGRDLSAAEHEGKMMRFTKKLMDSVYSGATKIPVDPYLKFTEEELNMFSAEGVKITGEYGNYTANWFGVSEEE